MKLTCFSLLLGFVPSPAPGALPDDPSVLIGNFYYHAPNGISFIKDNAAAFVMDPGGSCNAGTVSPDYTFQRTLFTAVSTPRQRVEFQWSRRGDGIVGRIISQKQGEMTFNLGENWPGFSSRFAADSGGVTGTAGLAGGKTITWALEMKPAPRLTNGTQLTVALGGPSHPVYLVAGFGKLPAWEGIDAELAAAEKTYEDRRPKAAGPRGDILGAIADNMNNSRMYSNDYKKVAISVSRTFSVGNGNTCPYFCWDSFFSALLASLDDPAAAHETVRAILAGQTSEGLVPNYWHWERGISRDRSQPPVGAMCVWKINQYHPDAGFLAEMYPKLAVWHDWWMKARNARHDGLLEWGSSTGALQSAQYETGWDDTPQFEGVPGVKMAGTTMNAYAVDLCSLWSMDAHYLGLIAEALGMPADARRYRRQERDMNDRINAKLWNEKLGIYCSRFWDAPDGTPGKFLTRLTPANFYPLICGAPNAEQARRVLAIMTDPAQFWGEWILPTVSREDPLFFGQTYWHGTIWGPVNYLVFQGVKRYAPPDLESAFARKSVDLFMNTWQATGECGENYLSLNGEVGGNPNYTWGALLSLVGVESVVDVGDDGTPRLGPGFGEPVEFVNMPLMGRNHRVSLTMGKAAAVIDP